MIIRTKGIGGGVLSQIAAVNFSWAMVYHKYMNSGQSSAKKCRHPKVMQNQDCQ